VDARHQEFDEIIDDEQTFQEFKAGCRHVPFGVTINACSMRHPIQGCQK
jgi:hypothetical protein